MSAFKESPSLPFISSDRVRNVAVSIGHHPFLAASVLGYPDMISILIKEGKMDVNFRSITRGGPNTALMGAILYNQVDVIKLLLEQGAAIDYIDSKSIIKQSPISQAAKRGNKIALELIFNELRNRSDKLMLHEQEAGFGKNIQVQCEEACLKGCISDKTDIVEVLLRQGGVDVNLCIEQRRLLSYAVRGYQFSTVKLLVKYGARMENERDCGIVTAMYRDHIIGWEIVIYLLKSGCNVANGGIHACALWSMAHLGSLEERQQDAEDIKRLLLQNGYDPNKCRHGCWEAVQTYRRGKARSLEQSYNRGRLPDLLRDKNGSGLEAVRLLNPEM